MLVYLIKATTKLLVWILLISLVSSCFNPRSRLLSIEVFNNSTNELLDVIVELNNPGFLEKLNEFDTSKITVVSDDIILPFQFVKSSTTGLIETVLVLCAFKDQEQRTISFVENRERPLRFPKRTQAEISIKEGGTWKKIINPRSGVNQYEYQGGKFKNVNYLRVPDKHTDNSYFIRYEGPGWESDKIAYRFYLDWRNAVDIFGKATPEMVLQNVGRQGFESFHQLNSWGMDVLHVGSSLGIGSIGFWDGQNATRIALTDSITCSIRQNGVIRSSIHTNYFGWRDSGISLNLESNISIDAGSRLTHEHIILSTLINNICTGIVKHDSAQLFRSEATKGEWAYLATFGNQSLNGDKLGMFIFYNKSKLVKVTEDAYSYVLVLLPENKQIDYYFGAVWEKDNDNISTNEQFIAYLNFTLDRLNTPLIIKN